MVKDYPIISIEDGLDENDWEGWSQLNLEIGTDVQIVGDDLTVTNIKRLQRSIDEKSMLFSSIERCNLLMLVTVKSSPTIWTSVPISKFSWLQPSQSFSSNPSSIDMIG